MQKPASPVTPPPAAAPVPAAAAPAPPVPSPVEPVTQKSMMPILIGAAVVVILLALLGAGLFLGWFGRQQEFAQQPTSDQATSSRATDSSLALQTPGGAAPVDTPTPSGPQLALPVVDVLSSEVRPIVLGALPSTDTALLLVNVRVENVGNAPFVLLTNNFTVRTADGESLPEAGGTTTGSNGRLTRRIIGSRPSMLS